MADLNTEREVKESQKPTDECVHNDDIAKADSIEENRVPFMIARGKDSITDPSDCPPSPLLLERSMVEFERQIQVVYNSKMIPRPTSTLTENSSVAGSTLRKNGSTFNRNSLPPNGAAIVQNDTKNCCLKCSNAFRSLIENAMDTFFFNYGKLVATYPCTFIVLCVILTAVCGAGMINFRMENTGLKLWIPYDSSQR